jgi:hypothetical protein
VLGAGDVAGLADALVAARRRSSAYAVDVAGGNSGGACQGDEDRIDVGAFAAQVVVSSMYLTSPTPQPRVFGSRKVFSTTQS